MNSLQFLFVVKLINFWFHKEAKIQTHFQTTIKVLLVKSILAKLLKAQGDKSSVEMKGVTNPGFKGTKGQKK